MKALWKNLLMGLIGVIGAAFSDMETLVPAYITLVTVLFTVQYFIKNWLMPSLSDKLSIDTRDFISAGLAAVFMSVSVYAATLLTDVEFTWLALWKAVSVAVVGYLTKTVPSKSKTIPR